MNSPQATVSKILTYSCVDGPGNRLVIFLQGCNFNCPSCHNPHTIDMCTNCGDCIPACHAKALSMTAGKIVFDPAACDQCDACLQACPINANPMVSTCSVGDILDLARKHRLFLNGITISGGEATTQLKFIACLFKAVKADPELSDLTCFIDSNGHLGEAGWAKVLDHTDSVMLDIKAFEPHTHKFLTGRSNERALRSAQILHQAGKLHELRFLVIPGHTDTPAELEKLCVFVRSLGSDVKVKLNAFQHHGVVGPALDWPKTSKETIEAAALKLHRSGITQVATPIVYV
jgi:YjjW family glycine radical enzyme activase